MRFLDWLFVLWEQPSEVPREVPRLVYERGFSDPPCILFPTPSLAEMDVQQGSPPLVKFVGTFWRFRVYDPKPCKFVDGQMVKVVGRQGNRLLIELLEPETSNE